MTQRAVPKHGGDRRALAARAGCAPGELLDFSANINPLGMPPAARRALIESVDALADYPDPACTDLCAAIAAALGVLPAQVLPGNGAEQLIWWLPRILGARRVLVSPPCYLDYARAALVWGLAVLRVPLRAEQGFELDVERLAALARTGDLVWIGQPNNPTGRIIAADALRRAAAARPGVWWAVDEAFIDFADGAVSAVGFGLDNVVVVRSMTKFFALPGLRLGYAVLAPGLASAARGLLPDWSVSTPAQRVGVALLTDPARHDFAERTRRLIRTERALLAAGLRALGASVLDSAANYLLLRLPETAAAGREVADRLLVQHRIAVRTYGTEADLDEQFLRVAVRAADDNRRLLAALGDVLATGASREGLSTRVGGA
jgi:L-threonine-O-3-phosphate decarboxylase